MKKCILDVFIQNCVSIIFMQTKKDKYWYVGGGGLQNGRGGGGKSFSHAEGGHKRFWGSFFCGSLKFLLR